MPTFFLLIAVISLTTVNCEECTIDDYRCHNTNPDFSPDVPKDAFLKLFEKLDANNDNRISFIELLNHAHPKELRKRFDYFDLFDRDHNGYLGLKEFQALAFHVRKDLKSGLFSLFKNMDANGDSQIDVFEYLLYNRQRVPPLPNSVKEHIDTFKNSIDADHNGVVSRNELLEYRKQRVEKFFNNEQS